MVVGTILKVIGWAKGLTQTEETIILPTLVFIISQVFPE